MKQEKYLAIRNALAAIIKDTLWENHVFLVGGCVRDDFMNREIHDIDLAIDLHYSGGVEFVNWLNNESLTRGKREFLTFPEYNAAKFRLRDFPDDTIDVAQMRKYNGIVEDKRRLYYGTIEEDARRRDLTINSLYINLSTNEFLDPTGMGVHDIDQHIIRTPNEPDTTFTDNPKNILRCIRFATEYGWELDASLKESMKRCVQGLSVLSYKRIVRELFPFFRSDNKERGLQLLEEIGAMEFVAPSVEFLNEVPDYYYPSEWKHKCRRFMKEYKHLAYKLKNSERIEKTVKKAEPEPIIDIETIKSDLGKLQFTTMRKNLATDIINIIQEGYPTDKRATDQMLLPIYWLIGKRIEIEVRHKSESVTYFDDLLKDVSLEIAQKFGSRFNLSRLQAMAKFYRAYPNEKRFILCCQTPWSRIRIVLKREDNSEARDWYILNNTIEHWNMHEFSLKVRSHYYQQNIMEKENEVQPSIEPINP